MNRSKDPTNQTRYQARYQTSADSIPTRELLKAERKREYEKAKAARKEEKAADKARKAQVREEARSERDKALWASMKRATDLDGDE